MRAILLPGDRTVELANLPDPVPGEGEVLIQMHYSAICGTDLHRYRQPRAELASTAHMVTGHEPVGVVAALGPGVRWPSAGDRVVVHHIVGCNRPECAACRNRQPKLCRNRRVMMRDVHGSNADYLVLPAINCLPLPDSFAWEEGAILACNFGTAWAATRKVPVSGQTVVAVFGLGPVGLCLVLSARAMGAPVIGVDVVAERLELASKLGASAVIDATAENPAARIRDHTEGLGCDAAIDTSGASVAQTNALDSLRREGKMMVVGVGTSKEWTIRPREQLMVKEATIQGTHVYEATDWERMLRFVRRHRLNLSAIVDRLYDPEQAVEAFRRADEGRSGKILFRWR